jgi:hypothetical protein
MNFCRGGSKMKAVLALVIIYVGTFLVAVQSPRQSTMQAAPPVQSRSTPTIDPAKEADLRSLMELLGVRDAVQELAGKSIEQFRENLIASVPANDRGLQFVKTFVSSYQKQFNPDAETEELINLYDKHFSDDEIEGLLEFYGSPLGQKYADEMPKLTIAAQAMARATNTSLAKGVIQELRKRYPEIAAKARLEKPGAAQQQQQVKQQLQAEAIQP